MIITTCRYITVEMLVQLYSKRSNSSTHQSRPLHAPAQKENDVVDYSDDWDSDYSNDWELDIDDIQKPATILQQPLSKPKPPNNSISLVPCDPAAFNASFCRKRQAAIDSTSYRQAIDSWKAKALHDVVKLMIDLSSGKSLFDRAWIIFLLDVTKHWIRCRGLLYW